MTKGNERTFITEKGTPFPVGVEYYRAPAPPRQFWDEDFARIRAGGLRIVRSFTFWNWLEPAPGLFEFEDLDYLFELAAKHDLKVWLDITVSTHGACPEWMLRLHPDMRVVWPDGRVQQQTAGDFAPQGLMAHNYDHPKWREYAERFVRAMVGRYKDHSNLLIWGTCDGANLSAAWADGNGACPHNDYTIEKYIRWLKERFTLDQLNERLLRRYRCWEDVQPPRSNRAPVEMLLYRQFHYENIAEMLGWLVDLINRLDGQHEQRSHGGYLPRPWDELASKCVDGWGLSLASSDWLTSDDPYSIALEYIGFDWSRAIGKHHRWWMEEIYSAGRGGFMTRGKQTAPEELTALLWLSLVAGSAGALFWQYRPEYMSFEGPAFNLAALDGTPNRRWEAVTQAVREIDSIAGHLPPGIPQAEVAMAYSAPSHEIFTYNDQARRFECELAGVYRTIWAESIPQDIVTLRTDWSLYKVVYLPNFAVLDDAAIRQIRTTLKNCPQTRLVALGHLGTLAGNGHWSYRPPEGIDDLVTVRVADFERITAKDIREGRNRLVTEYGEFRITKEIEYAILEPQGAAKAVATLNGDVVAVETAGRRLSWWGLALSEGFGGVAPREWIVPLLRSLGVVPPFTLSGDRLVAFRRHSRQGGSLIFLFNLEPSAGRATVKPNWPFGEVTNLLEKEKVRAVEGSFEVVVPPWSLKLLHAADA